MDEYVISIGSSDYGEEPSIEESQSATELTLYNKTNETLTESITTYDNIEAGEEDITHSGDEIHTVKYSDSFDFLKGRYVARNGNVYRISGDAEIRKKLETLNYSTTNYRVGMTTELYSTSGYPIDYYKDAYADEYGEIFLIDHVTRKATDATDFSDIFGKYFKQYGNDNIFYIDANATIIAKNTYDDIQIKCDYLHNYSVSYDGRIIEYSDTETSAVKYYYVDYSKIAEMQSALVGKYYYQNGERYQISEINARESARKMYFVIEGCKLVSAKSQPSFTVKTYGHLETYVPGIPGEADYVFRSKDMMEVTAHLKAGLLGDELNYDTFDATVIHQGAMPNAEYGTPIWFFKNSQVVLKQYIESLERSKLYKTLHCVSSVGLLDKMKHHGGVYNGTPCGDIIDDIFGAVETNYEISEDIAEIPVFGWLPYDNAKDNLYRLLLAYNISIIREATNPEIVLFTFVGQDTATDIVDADVYMGSSSDFKEAPTEIEITEHTFVDFDELAEEVELFDNTDTGLPANRQLVLFSNAPIHTIHSSDGLTVHESNENYAIVSGIGTITGLPYFHQKRTLRIQTGVSSVVDSTKSITDDCLISNYNSNNVASKLIGFYTHSRDLKSEIRLLGEKCGYKYNITDDIGEEVQNAYLGELDLTVSSIIKAMCKFVIGATIIGKGLFFDSVTRLTNRSGVYTVPDGVNKIRVVMIGGGSGGDSGFKGERGKVSSNQKGAEGGKGGSHGKGGSGGRIYTVDLDVSPGDTFNYTCGVGGAPGSGSGATEKENVQGSQGTASTFGTYTSNYGYSSKSGFYETLSGVKYGLPSADDGLDGADGGVGGDSFPESEEQEQFDLLVGKPGGNVGAKLGGSGGNYIGDFKLYLNGVYANVAESYPTAAKNVSGGYVTIEKYCGGGGGGGASALNRGSNGYDPSGEILSDNDGSLNIEDNSNVEGGYGGGGAHGGTRSDVTPNYGCGGAGGHGGGGGGGQGGTDTTASSVKVGSFTISSHINCRTSAEDASFGGNAGTGTYGGDGVIFVYFSSGV